MVTLSAQEIYDRRAGFYDRVMNSIRHEATRTNLLRSLPLPHELPAGARILDIGCGTGLVANFLLQKYTGVQVIGLDIAENMLAIHQAKYPSVALVKGDFNVGSGFVSFPGKQPVTFTPASFDLMVSAGALSEYGQAEKAIPWCYELLKPGGMLINIGVHDNWFGTIIGWLWHFKPFGTTALLSACREAGFTKTEIVRPTWKVFPKNLTDYTVRAVK